MKICPRAGYAVAIATTMIAPLASAGDPAPFGWFASAPVVTSRTSDTGMTNPIDSNPDDRSLRREITKESIQGISVDLYIARFGLIPAPAGLGGMENAFGELALREMKTTASDHSQILGVGSATSEANETRVHADDAEIGRIEKVLFEGVSNDDSRAYRSWIAQLSSEDLDRLLKELSSLVSEQKTDAADSNKAVTEANLRHAIAQLRGFDALSREEATRDATLVQRLGLEEDSAADRDRDARAIERSLVLSPSARTPDE